MFACYLSVRKSVSDHTTESRSSDLKPGVRNVDPRLPAPNQLAGYGRVWPLMLQAGLVPMLLTV